MLCFAFCGGLWIGGNKGNISKSAEDPSGFTDTFDVSETTMVM
jgi:hypothetical protein